MSQGLEFMLQSVVVEGFVRGGHPREGSWFGHGQPAMVNRLAISAQGNRRESALTENIKGALKMVLNPSKASQL